MKNYFVILFFFQILLISCTQKDRIPEQVTKALNLAGGNKSQLQIVIDHYTNKGENEKLQAAYYLISNLPGRQSIVSNDVFVPLFDQISDTIKANGKIKSVFSLYNRLYTNLVAANPNKYNIKFQSDLNAVSADFLIENINLAFDVYKRIPDSIRCSFDVFKKYVLPYSLTMEPIEPDLRKALLLEYMWVYEKMGEGVPLPEIVCALMKDLDLASFSKMKFKGLLLISQVKKIGFGNCDNLVTLAVHVLRSVGIPATMDFVPQWGNHYGMGHSWLVFFSGDSIVALNPIKQKNLVDFYHEESIPKVYRRCFDKGDNIYRANTIDVTNEYQDSKNISIQCFDKESSVFQLVIFSKFKGWSPVAISNSIKWRKINFENVGTNVIYNIRSEKGVIGDPFIVQDDSKIRNLSVNFDKVVTAKLTRKYPPYFFRENEKLDWINSINGVQIQAANHADFSDSVILLTIHNYSSSNPQFIENKDDNKYKYYRLKCINPKPINIADFNLLDGDRNDYSTKVDISNWKGILGDVEKSKILDKDPLTYYMSTWVTITFTLDEPKNVKFFRIQARNDDNNIRPGDAYELFYWSKGWQSAGEKIATDTLLVYKDIPADGVYWLKNNTRGKEEHLFLLDEDGNQLWTGINYPDIHYSKEGPPDICKSTINN